MKDRYRGKGTKYIISGKGLMAFLCAICITFVSVPIASHATESTREKLEKAKEAKKESQNQLEGTKDDIVEMNEEKSALQGQLNSLNDQLSEVSSNLEEIEEQIENKENEIENTKAELEVARETEANQYASMKKRVQFIYEKQNFVLIDMLLGARSFADFLNQNDYV